MILTANTFIDGVWYGPDYGNADLPDHIVAKMGVGDVDALTMQLRTRLVSGFTRMVAQEILPRFVTLSAEDQTVVLDRADDPGAVLGELVARLRAMPEPIDAAPLGHDDQVLVADGRWIRRGDLVAILDLIDEQAPELLAGAPADVAAPIVDQAAPAPDPAPLVVPEGSVDDLLAWVNGADPGEPPTDGWAARAAAALAAEHAGGHARKTLVEPLERALAAAEGTVA